MYRLIEKSCLSHIDQVIENGGWESVYRQLGIDEKCWTKQNQVCPFCGGKDRFSIFKKNGVSYCRHCGSRNTFKFIQDYKYCSFVEAVEYAADALGITVVYQEPKKTHGKDSKDSWKKLTADEVWATGTPLDEECGSARYLLERGLPGPYPQSLRHCNELVYFEFSEEDNSWSTKNLSGLLCQISLPDIETVNVLRIYLDGDHKADVKTPKKVLKGGLAGGFVKLGDLNPETGILGIAEGVETALSASILYGMPVWSVLNSTNMHNFAPPKEVRELHIFGDCDFNGVGQKAAFATAAALTTNYPDLKVKVHIPEVLDTDWNDVLLNQDRSGETKNAF
ncbi:MAG: toprim domain-containing protein [Burkholderiales bacterium]|nr:toprim domain-containing protein [Burkholderiales bacterium]